MERMFKVHQPATRRLTVALGLVGVIGVMSYLPSSALAGTCGNEGLRAQQGSSFLPECRAYELVSPPGATAYVAPGGSVDGARAAEGLAASVGEISWFSYYPPAGLSNPSMHLLSTRTASGWGTRDVIPSQSTSSGAFIECGGYTYFSGDLATEILSDGQEQCPHNDPPLTEDEPEGFENLFLRDVDSESYSLVNLTPANEAPADAHLQDASTDFSHIVFSENAKLTPSAPAGDVLYEWVGGSVHLVSILPDGTPVSGRLVAEASPSSSFLVGFAPLLHSVSADGSRVIFESGGDLYERENAEMEQSQLSPEGDCLEADMACTVQVDASATGGLGGGGQFIAATAQGTDVFFTDGGVKKLTSDTVPSSGQNLYEFDLETGQLSDLTPFASAHVLGLAGLGEEGSAWHLYIAAEGAFGEVNAEGHEPQEGAPNLYELSRESSVAFLATLAPGDWKDWQGETREAAAAPNGRFLVFGSVAELTGYDNRDAATAQPDSELFAYDAVAQRLECVSCGPANVRPIGATGISAVERSSVNGWGPGYLRRNVFNDGSVVFDTPNPLVAGDADGRRDVYLYSGGQAHLISSGTSAENSYYYEASGLNPVTGGEAEDVFFATSQHLAGADAGNGPALYDARVEGGLSEPATQAPACSDESCRGGSPSEPSASAPASATFMGLGNITPTVEKPTTSRKKPRSCRKGTVRRHGKCVKKKRGHAKGRAGKSRKARKTTATGRVSHV